MHVRRHDEPTKGAIEVRRNEDVAVVEHRGRVEHNLEDQHGDGRRTQNHDDRQFDDHGEKDFNRVKTCACCDVEIQIGVVHAVQPPEGGHGVEHDVLEVDGEVEDQHRQQDRQPIRRRQTIQQPPAPLFGNERQTHSGRGDHEAQENRVKGDNTQIARPSDPARDRAPPAGHQNLPQRHEREHPKKEAEADSRFVRHG